MTALPVDDHEDFADADRGFIAALDPPEITMDDGRVVWNAEAYRFLAQNRPDTAHESLWRQGRLVSRQGLFEVTDGIYQVRGLDFAHMTLVEGDHGVIVIDPLHSAETAAAALELYRKHRGDQPVTGLIYTHSHREHFGGARGVLPYDHHPVPVLAPAGFLEHAAGEHLHAGTALRRRAVYAYGDGLPKGPDGQIGCGLGATRSTGTVTLIPPTVDITRTGQEEILDGVRLAFQLTPGTEAPAEMNFCLPAHRALCLAENLTHTLHHLLPLYGGAVRDARTWSRHLGEALALFGGEAEVAFACHHWPTWGKERVTALLADQRDLYAYLHDQTLRLLNEGYSGPEIAEDLRLPPRLAQGWAHRGYYGSVSHNVKAIAQRYLGWYDGNPAHLWEHPLPSRPSATCTPWEASRPPWTRASSTPPTVICGSPPPSSTTPSSPNRRTSAPAAHSPRSTNGWATAARTPPGATPTSPAPWNCAAPSPNHRRTPPTPRRPRCSPSTSSSTRSPSASTARAPGPRR